MGNIWIFICLFGILFKDIILFRKILVQTRTSSYYLALKILKIIFNNIKIVYDSRGASAEKYLLSNTPSNSDIVNYNNESKKQIQQINLADAVFCVSNKLKKYHLEKDVNLKENKLSVIPGYADSSKYYFNSEERKIIRKKLNIEDKVVCVYSGAIDKKWQIPDFIFQFIRLLNSRYKNMYYMFLTPNKSLVFSYADKYKIDKENIFSDYIPFNKINNYLSASDFSILLREDKPTNNVACPTKFSEYLLNGLPIIISKKIGDCSDLVKNNNFGAVVDNDLENILQAYKEQIIPNLDKRENISNFAKQNLSKQSKVDNVISKYWELLNQ